MKKILFALLSLAIFLAACGTPIATPTSPTETRTPTPTATLTPTATPLPACWNWEAPTAKANKVIIPREVIFIVGEDCQIIAASTLELKKGIYLDKREGYKDYPLGMLIGLGLDYNNKWQVFAGNPGKTSLRFDLSTYTFLEYGGDDVDPHRKGITLSEAQAQTTPQMMNIINWILTETFKINLCVNNPSIEVHPCQ